MKTYRNLWLVTWEFKELVLEFTVLWSWVPNNHRREIKPRSDCIVRDFITFLVILQLDAQWHGTKEFTWPNSEIMGASASELFSCTSNKGKIYVFVCLIYWGHNKMAAILQATISKTFSGQKIFWTAVKILWNFVPKGPQAMAWHKRVTGHYLNQCRPHFMMSSLGLKELILNMLNCFNECIFALYCHFLALILHWKLKFSPSDDIDMHCQTMSADILPM